MGCGGRDWRGPPPGEVGAPAGGVAVRGRGAWAVVLHIHPGVLVGVVAWFQRFPGTGGVRGRDECATRASLHIHPGSRPRVVRWIRVILPFTDRSYGNQCSPQNRAVCKNQCNLETVTIGPVNCLPVLAEGKDLVLALKAVRSMPPRPHGKGAATRPTWLQGYRARPLELKKASSAGPRRAPCVYLGLVYRKAPGALGRQQVSPSSATDVMGCTIFWGRSRSFLYLYR